MFMLRCLDLAEKGRGTVSPNPMVGCVIVAEGLIIGEGYHTGFGAAHAEIEAIMSVKEKKLLKKSRLYVNLEPCSHYGKTPPCADEIIRLGIPEVIIGVSDPNPMVSGKGIDKLRQAGIKVVDGILKEQSEWVNRRFINFHRHKKPYIILKWAQTKDGYIDRLRNDLVAKVNWITDENSRILVHKWRSEEQAVMVGANTVVKDNPLLTCRDWSGKNPLRVVIDSQGVLTSGYRVFDYQSPTFLFSNTSQTYPKNVSIFNIDNPERSLISVLEVLYKNNIQSLIVEGGLQLLQSFIDSNLWNEARIFTGNLRFGGGISAPRINGKQISSERLGEDVLDVLVAG